MSTDNCGHSRSSLDAFKLFAFVGYLMTIVGAGDENRTQVLAWEAESDKCEPDG